MSEIMLAIAYQEQLAAKDAEIAELRARLDQLGSQHHEDLRRLAAVVEQRDEAREYVGRLYEALKSIAERSPILDDEGLDEDEHHCEWTLQHERKRIHAVIKLALAATPEHLRK